MIEICGFLDDNGKFWKTQEEALESNDRIKERKLQDKISILLVETFGWPFYSPHYIVDVNMGDLSKAIFDHPEKFLTILWEVTKYKFNKKFNES